MEPQQPTTNSDALAADLIAAMPNPNLEAIAAGPPGATQVDDAGSGPDKGAFDPERHVTGPDGKPMISKDGTFRGKPGRKKGAASIVGSPSTGVNMSKTAQSPSKAEVEAVALEHRAAVAGSGAANLLIMAGLIIGGPDFAPGKSPVTGMDEREFLTGEFKTYFVATGQGDLPPIIGVIAAVLIYVAPRMQRPGVKAHVGGIATWFKAKFKRAK